MKLGIFTDSHYSTAEITCGRRYNSRSAAKIGEAYRAFGAAGCELVLCLGDLIDTETAHETERENLSLCADIIRAGGIPTLCMMGNHDAFAFTREEFYAVLGEEMRPPFHLTANDGMSHLFFADACYFSSGKPYAPGDSDWTDTFFPGTDALKTALETVDGSGSAYLFLHQDLDPDISPDHCLSNAAEVREILEQSGVVRAVFAGHYHPGHDSIHAGIQYRTFPAMCERDGREMERYWIVEI
ncbi:MAG: metallophosphoesterase [Clostridia bacterium]|nr:metallophosphoesterase [Clostridia bacterium]